MSDIVEIVKKGLNDLDGKYAAKMANLEDMVRDVAQQQSHVPGLSAKTGPGAAGNSIARLLADSESLKALRERKSRSATITADIGLDLLVKSALVGDVASSTTDLYPVEAYRDPRIGNDVRVPLSLAARLPRLPVNSGSFEYVALTSAYTDDADYQLTQGAAKHQTAMPMELKTATIATIASLLFASEQVLADQASLTQFIAGKLGAQVLTKLEHELINGAGGAGEISGLLNESSIFVPTSDLDYSDAIGECAAHMQALGHQPNLVLLHPKTWQSLRSVRVDAGAGLYLSGGWSTMPQPVVWGVPVLPCAAMPLTKAIVMDTTQVAILDRQSVTFDAGYIDSQFAQNMRTLRSELRAGLAVFTPTAVQSFDV